MYAHNGIYTKQFLLLLEDDTNLIFDLDSISLVENINLHKICSLAIGIDRFEI